jgi:hypothetical protein
MFISTVRSQRTGSRLVSPLEHSSNSTRGEIRTHTAWFLKPMPPAVGLLGHTITRERFELSARRILRPAGLPLAYRVISVDGGGRTLTPYGISSSGLRGCQLHHIHIFQTAGFKGIEPSPGLTGLVFETSAANQYLPKTQTSSGCPENRTLTGRNRISFQD